MRRVHGHRSQQRLYGFYVVIFNVQPRRRTQLLQTHHANRFRPQRRQQLFAPAVVLRFHEAMNFLRQLLQHFRRRAPIRPGLAIAVLHLLQDAGHAHLHELVQVARRDREKLHPLEQRISLIARLFQHSFVELHPRMVPVEDVLWVRYIVVFHDVLAAGESIAVVLQPCYQGCRVHLLPSVSALLGPASKRRYAPQAYFPRFMLGFSARTIPASFVR